MTTVNATFCATFCFQNGAFAQPTPTAAESNIEGHLLKTADEKLDFETATIKSFPSLVGHHRIAVTIDDGPTEVTPRMLDVLKENGIHATFFLIGRQVVEHPDIVRRIVAEGHLIGNHTFTHPNMLKMNPTTHQWECLQESFIYDEIRRAHEVILPYVPAAQHHLYFRPPGGGWCAAYATSINNDPELRHYVGPLYWVMGGSIWQANEKDPHGPLLDAGDEECWTSAHVSVARCLAGYEASVKRHNGGVLLNHDIHMQSVQLLASLLPKLRAENYRFVTLDEVPELDHRGASSDEHSQAIVPSSTGSSPTTPIVRPLDSPAATGLAVPSENLQQVPNVEVSKNTPAPAVTPGPEVTPKPSASPAANSTAAQSPAHKPRSGPQKPSSHARAVSKSHDIKARPKPL